MRKDLIKYFLDNPKDLSHLEENSYMYKYLNRNPLFLKEYLNIMKEKYHERVSDKIYSTIDAVEMVSNVIDTL